MTQDEANTEQVVTKNEIDSRRVTKTIVFIAVVFTALGVFLGWASASRKGLSETGEIVGSMLGVVLFGLVVVVLFQLFRRFRNQRSRWKIYCWAAFLMSLGALANLFQELKPLVSSY